MAEPTEALDNFIGKWRARWPEWAVAEVFLPPAQRDLARAWATLQQELTDAAWGGSDPTPGEAKLAWWQEELAGWGRGARRHPLGTVLQRQPAPWAGLAATLPSLAASRDRPGTTEDAFASVRPFARAAAPVGGPGAGAPGGRPAETTCRLADAAHRLACRPRLIPVAAQRTGPAAPTASPARVVRMAPMQRAATPSTTSP